MHREWNGRTDGGTLLQRWLIALLRWVDVRVIYFFMAFIVPFYMVINRQGYKAMRDYFALHRGKKGLGLIWHIYRNHFVFGQVIIDRFAVYAGRKFTIVNNGKEKFDRQMLEPSGAVMLSSHVGNYELAGGTFTSDNKTVYALVYSGETRAVMQSRAKMLPTHNIEMIPVAEDMSHIFLMNNAIDSGDVISMPADRRLGSQKSIECQFMGATAQFPAGPFVFVAQKEIPAFAIFVMKKNAKTYNLYVRQLETPATQLNIRQRSAILAQSFASELETVIDEYPYQWFNYYDFWYDDKK